MLDKQMPESGSFEAVVLAGGFGTRLASVVSDVPKPMASVAGRPFLCYLLDMLYHRGCRKVVLATGYKSEAIKEYFGAFYGSLNVVYSHELEPLGTGGAIKQALELCEDENVIVVNGDTLFDADICGMLEQHVLHDADLTLALRKVDDISRYGSVDVEKNLSLIHI